MNTNDFDYLLPTECIAAFPAVRRDGSRLLRLGRHDGQILHTDFAKLGEHLPPGALLVLNDTRVIPARLRARKPTGGATELLLTRRKDEPRNPDEEEEWEAIGRNLGRTPPGTVLEVGGGLVAEITARGDDGFLALRLRAPVGETVMGMLERVGELPLPPYIEIARRRRGTEAMAQDEAKNSTLDRDRYQTVFATHAGAVAAPTAGLHFTDELLAALVSAGHGVVRLTLHVGLGTFRPVKVETIESHQMEREWYSLPPATADAVNAARAAGRPVVAVGTTVVRALESSAQANGGRVVGGGASSRLFLRPGSSFNVVTDLITNFHLPRSTLLMLVAAFAGRERVLAAYAEAIAAGYRFYSYGDAMLIRGSM